MLAELRCLFGHDVVPAAKLNWQAFISDIVKQARLECGARITKAVSELLDDEDSKCCGCACWDASLLLCPNGNSLIIDRYVYKPFPLWVRSMSVHVCTCGTPENFKCESSETHFACLPNFGVGG